VELTDQFLVLEDFWCPHWGTGQLGFAPFSRRLADIGRSISWREPGYWRRDPRQLGSSRFQPL